MWTFTLKRLFHLIPILVGVSLLTFLLMSLTPGDYFTILSQNPQISPDKIAELRAKLHLDRAWYVQYYFWLIHALQGDLGYSIAYKIPATELITARLWNTFILSFCATCLSWIVAVPLGSLGVVNKNKVRDLLLGVFG